MHRWGNKKDMAGDDPPYLSVGTEVSAKYKGAFCEAKIRKVVKAVKCKVQYKNESGSAFVNDEQIKGVLMPGASVEVKQPDRKEYIEGTIIKIQDLSQYTVVFDDGDIATLRRTALCLKSGRHFAESETLDQLPLTHPEHFSTPVVSGVRGSRRRDEMEDNSDDEKRERKIEREEDMGKVVCVEIGDKKKSKDNWFPGLIVAPNAQDSVKIDVEDEYLIRSFKDGRYYTVPKRETVEFTREAGAKVDQPTLKAAVEKAISFLDKDDLPPHWDREVLFGMADYTSESDGSDTDSTDDEPREEKDHFVAQLYKFMDDRGTPINKEPMISSKDVDLYKLFKIVNKLGGYNRVTNRNQWKSIAVKLGYSANQTNNVKTSYKKYLHNFEDFYRKLGCTMLSHNTTKLRSRSHRPLIRDRDKSLPEKAADKEDTNENDDDIQDAKEQQNGVKTKIDSQDDDDKSKEIKKEIQKIKNVEIVDKKIKIEAIDAPTAPKIKIKDEVKDEKIEKKNEKKMVKATKSECNDDNKKSDKVKPKSTLKGVEKRKKDNVLPGIRTKRSLKDRMKAIVKRLKLISSNEQDKKKQKPADEANKASPQLCKIKTKEDILNNATKTRKLSVDGKSVGGSDRKSTSSSTSGGNTSDGGNSNGAGKTKKDDDDGPKKKTYSRKKKEEDKSSSSSDNLINQSIEIVSPHKTIHIGDKLKVYYGPTHESKVTYEAKVMNKRYGAVTEYFVHYTGWNTRYDEWIRRSRIAENLSWTPARDKGKFNQNEVPEPCSQSEQNVKLDKSKRSSISPVGKARSKSVTKRPGRTAKSKSPSKTDATKGKKKNADSESSDYSETEQKQELQKTRSRTEKQKQQDEDTDTKCKKPAPLKRTRSGSLKLEKEEPPKKRKAAKKTRTNVIRNSIMKSLVPRKRIEKGKKLLKRCDKESEKSDTEVTADEPKAEDVEEMEKIQCEETELVLQIKPFPVQSVVEEETKPDEADIDEGPPVLKKEVDEDPPNQQLADSYLAENLDKAKPKKKDDKSPAKIFNREKVKSGDVKEKTFFTSRVEKEVKKEEKEKKDPKRNTGAFSSYLSMDKIDSIKKVNPEKLSKSGDKCEDDVYEFKEPEPFEFRGIDDRTILHRRPPSRIFDDTYKRAKSESNEKEDDREERVDEIADEKIDADEKNDTAECEPTVDVESRNENSKGETIESNLFGLQCEDEEDEDMDETKLIISEPEQQENSESITSKILGSKINEISVAFRLDEDEKSDTEKMVDTVELKCDDESPEQPEKLVDEESDDESLSSAKSGPCFEEKDKASESGSTADDKDDEYFSSDSPNDAVELTVTKQEHALKTYSSETGFTPKKKIVVETAKIDEIKSEDTSCNDLPVNANVDDTVIRPSIIDEVEIEIFTAAKKDLECETKEETDWNDKTTDDQKKDEDDNDGLLLCEETIPKSPETKDTSNADELSYPGSSGLAEVKKLPDKIVKRGARPYAAATVFENTPPTTPEGSTPGNSPSDERSGFSSNTFSLNEKSNLKDSSENDTYSDNSEKSLRTKRFRDEGATYKKNSYDFDYAKKKDKDGYYKNDEPSRKKAKYGVTSNESERDDFSDEANSPKSSNVSQKFTKSSYYMQLDPDLDANQRIEILEQKLQEVRKAYLALKQELLSIDKRRKKLRRREREGRMMTRNEANSLL